MNISRPHVKQNSKVLIKERSPQVYLTAFEHMFVVWILTLLLTRLSGYREYTEAYYSFYRATGELYTGAWPSVKLYAWLICIAAYLLIMIIDAGYAAYTLMVSRGQMTDSRSAMSGFDHPLKVICIGLIQKILIYVGLAFFIVPGVMAAYSYKFAYYVLADHPEYSAIECLRESRRISKGYKMQLFMLDLSFIGWRIVNAIIESVFLPVVELWLLPYSGITFATYYNIITNNAFDNRTVPTDGGFFPGSF